VCASIETALAPLTWRRIPRRYTLGELIIRGFGPSLTQTG
jgi:hypothetical protein